MASCAEAGIHLSEGAASVTVQQEVENVRRIGNVARHGG
jgi:hypothetical protein